MGRGLIAAVLGLVVSCGGASSPPAASPPPCDPPPFEPGPWSGMLRYGDEAMPSQVPLTVRLSHGPGCEVEAALELPERPPQPGRADLHDGQLRVEFRLALGLRSWVQGDQAFVFEGPVPGDEWTPRFRQGDASGTVRLLRGELEEALPALQPDP